MTMTCVQPAANLVRLCDPTVSVSNLVRLCDPTLCVGFKLAT